MALMSRFAKLDSAMQRGLDNGIALIFGGKVVPAEIEELLKQEAQDNLSATARGYVPNVYAVGVSETGNCPSAWRTSWRVSYAMRAWKPLAP